MIEALERLHRKARITADAYRQSGAGVSRERYGIELYPPQQEIVRTVEEAIAAKDGRVITIRSARQTGKNECSALIHVRIGERYRRIGGEYVRTAPTWKPQIVRSIRRLKKYIRRVGIPAQWEYGFICNFGAVALSFLSGDPNASAVGDTASLALDVDEAQHFDIPHFDEAFAPMTASTNAPIILWGVAGYKTDLLFDYRESNFETNKAKYNLQYPASVWAELIPSYADHYENRKAKLGSSHPIIRTQYDLIDTDEAGGLFNKKQIDLILDSAHNRRVNPRRTLPVVMVVDVGGEAEDITTATNDETVIHVVEVDNSREAMRNEIPECRILDSVRWRGMQYAETREAFGQQEEILKLIYKWNPFQIVIDARGIGEQLAMFLDKNVPVVETYKATSQSVSQDIYNFIAMVNNGQVRYFRNDGSDEYRDFADQIRYVAYKMNTEGLIKLVKPKRRGDNNKIDMIKALTYLPRAIRDIEGVTLPIQPENPF